jgi:hypothetical protein
MFLFLIAILLIGGAAAIVNDAAYGGSLFSSGIVVHVAILSALLLWIGDGFFSDTKPSQWVLYALIWMAIALGAGLIYRLL